MSSNFPNGFNGVTIRGISILQLHPGEVFYVNNSSVAAKGGVTGADSTGASGTYHNPFKTFYYAIGRCTAGRGDIIAAMPGHAETISAAAGMTFDVSGVALVGLGVGTLKPTITFDTATTADINVTAPNVSFSNIRFVSGIANLAAPLDINDDHCSFDNCEFMASAATTGMNISVITDANATGMAITNCT